MAELHCARGGAALLLANGLQYIDVFFIVYVLIETWYRLGIE
jgi:hypothetical protein